MHRPDSPLFKNSIDTFPERILYLQRLLQKKFLTYTLPPEPTEPLKLLINASGRQFLSIQSSPYLIICLRQIVNGEKTIQKSKRSTIKNASNQKPHVCACFPPTFPPGADYSCSRLFCSALRHFASCFTAIQRGHCWVYTRESFFRGKTKQQQNAESMKHISRKGKKTSKISLFCL